MNGNAPPNSRKPRRTIGWTPIIAAVSLLVSTLLAIAALGVSKKVDKTTAATRIELGHFASNWNRPDYDRPWRLWVQPLPKVTYVGVQRQINFEGAFVNAPNVVTALAVVDIAPFDEIIKKTGYAVGTKNILTDFQVVSFADDVNSKGFTLCVGIGLPSEIATKLDKYLRSKPVDTKEVDLMRDYATLKAAAVPGALTPDEQWLMNFSTEVGSIDVTWIARAEDK